MTFNYLDSTLIDYFFEHPYQSTLIAAIKQIITTMPSERLVDLLNETHLPVRILEQVKPIFPSDNTQTILQNTDKVFKLSGQILDLTKFLYELDFDNCEDITTLKQGLNRLPLDQRIDQRKIEFGGPHQSKNSDSDEDEDEEDEDESPKVEEFKESNICFLGEEEEESDSDSSGDWLQQDDDDSLDDDSLDNDNNSPPSSPHNDSSDEEDKKPHKSEYIPPPPILKNDDSSEEDFDDNPPSKMPPLADSDDETKPEVIPFVQQ